MPEFAIQMIMLGVWLGLFILFISLELESAQLVSIWFAAGALVALILAAVNLDIGYQILTFALVSGVSAVGFKILFPNLGRRQSNDGVETSENKNIIGRELIVLKGATHFEVGEGKINGVIWSLTTNQGEEVLPGQTVIVTEILGNRLVVKKKGD